MPDISVVMPAYNSDKTIAMSIESVLKQTYFDFEFIIINDCSDDKTDEIIDYYASKDKRIKCFKNEKNSGVSYTRNIAISIANGDWIAFIDSDDIWEKNKLEKQMELAKSNQEISLIYTGSAFMNSNGEKYSYSLPVLPKIDYRTLLKKNLLSCSSVMVRKNVIKPILMPADDMHEDYATWLLILKKYKYAYGINEPLLVYRLSENSKSSNRLKSAKMIYKTYRYVGYNAMLSLFLMFRYSFYSIRKRYKVKNGGLI